MLQTKYKELIALNWDDFCETKEYKLIMGEVWYDKYEITVAQIADIDEVVNLVQNSFDRNNWVCSLFDMKYPREGIVRTISNGRMFVLNNKLKNEIVACTKWEDVFDVIQTHDETFNETHNASMATHLQELLVWSSKTAYNYVLSKHNNNLKYGECMFGGTTATKVGLTNMYALFLSVLTAYFMQKYIGYGIAIGEAAHKKTLKMATSMGVDLIAEFDVHNHVFKDGTHIDYYFNKLKQKK
eukprot:147595_1